MSGADPVPSAAIAAVRAVGWRRWLAIAAAWLVIGLGVFFTPLPTPFGLPLIAFGLTLLLGQSARARRLFVRLWRRFPETVTPIRRFLRRRGRTGPTPDGGPGGGTSSGRVIDPARTTERRPPGAAGRTDGRTEPRADPRTDTRAEAGRR